MAEPISDLGSTTGATTGSSPVAEGPPVAKDPPGQDLIRAVQAGCHAVFASGCQYPTCRCTVPGCLEYESALRAALAALAEPSEEMLAAVPDYRHLAEHCWRAIMRSLLGEGE